jgi:hypothetical protein
MFEDQDVADYCVQGFWVSGIAEIMKKGNT